MRNIFILASLSLILAVGCSKNKVEVTPSTEEAWVLNESLPVPIQFTTGSMTAETKATPLGSMDNLNNLDLGIFALAVSYNSDDQTGASRTPSWTTTNSETSTHLLKNEFVTTTAEGAIELDGKYYPINNSYTYSFYAYYPYQESATSLKTAQDGTYLFYADYDLGATDILYAKCDASPYVKEGTTYHGYNAKYVRETTKGGVYRPDELNSIKGRMPRLTFQHMLTGLKINALVVNGDANVKIKEVKLKNLPTKARLCIASLNETSNAPGTLTGQGSGDITLQRIADGASTGTTFNEAGSALTLTDSYQTLGEFFVLPAETYNIEVSYQLCSSDGTVTGESTLSANISKINPFVAGTKYTIGLKIDLAKIELLAELEGWVDYNEGQPIEPEIDYGN